MTHMQREYLLYRESCANNHVTPMSFVQYVRSWR